MTRHDDAGSSTDQHVTGAPEDADFPTDAEPTGDTPADGSSNAGVNSRDGNAVTGPVDEQPD